MSSPWPEFCKGNPTDPQSLSICPLGNSTHSDPREYPNMLLGQDQNEWLTTQARIRHGWSALFIAFEHPSPLGLAPPACGERQGWCPRAEEAG